MRLDEVDGGMVVTQGTAISSLGPNTLQFNFHVAQIHVLDALGDATSAQSCFSTQVCPFLSMSETNGILVVIGYTCNTHPSPTRTPENHDVISALTVLIG